MYYTDTIEVTSIVRSLPSSALLYEEEALKYAFVPSANLSKEQPTDIENRISSRGRGVLGRERKRTLVWTLSCSTSSNEDLSLRKVIFDK